MHLVRPPGFNDMALNPDKSDAIIIDTHQRSSSYSSLTSVDVAGSIISRPHRSSGRNVGQAPDVR